MRNKLARGRSFLAPGLTLGALGVVFGDIGTSPLYAINEIFFGHPLSQIGEDAILGGISLVFWTLSLVMSLKYVTYVLRADSDGEGGTFALYSLIHPHKTKFVSFLKIILMLSAGLLLGQGTITPAISVLSAIEGLSIMAPETKNYVVPLALIVLLGLFSIQSQGTKRMGQYFAPISICWFLTIGACGLFNVSQNPQILAAINPIHAIRYFQNDSPVHFFLLLGAVMLVVSGGEALFADMGHFGAKPIRKAWFICVFPALLLNYFGQGAYLLSGQVVHNQNIFYSMIPHWALLPVVILATLAAVVASQGLISGAFSLSAQAIALGLFPRLKKVHTHEEHSGQIYLPFINWALFLGATAMVVGFKTSNHLASAYGLTVAAVMLCTSLAMVAIANLCWGWSLLKSSLVFGSFAFLDLIFLGANSLRILEGGFIPLFLGLSIFVVIRIWRWGRKATYRAYQDKDGPSIQDLIVKKQKATEFIPRNVVLMVPRQVQSLERCTPPLVQFFLNRYGMLPKNLFLVEVVHNKIPFIHGSRSENITYFKDPEKGSLVSVVIRFGFMEEPNVEMVLEELAKAHAISLPSDPHQWLVHVSHERLIPSRSWSVWKKLRLRVFLFLRQMTQPAYYYYGLGHDVNLTLDIMPVRLK